MHGNGSDIGAWHGMAHKMAGENSVSRRLYFAASSIIEGGEQVLMICHKLFFK